jgi:putative membrane protein insertion efficiency factor
MKWVMIKIVLLYRVLLSPVFGGQCRYQPTCSQYAIDAINKYGAARGGWRAFKRISRCHPWGGEGHDPA